MGGVGCCCTCAELSVALEKKIVGGEGGKRGVVRMENPPPPGSAEAVHHRRAVGSDDDGGENANTKELTLSSATNVAESQKRVSWLKRVLAFNAVIEPSALARLSMCRLPGLRQAL